jgi:membrane-bound ClpP family serine protease
MARGWESKSIEAQQEEVATRAASTKPRLTSQEATRARLIEGHRLALQNVLQRLNGVQDLRSRQMLERAKADLEQKIQELGKPV